MTRLGIAICLLCLATSLGFAQSSPGSATPALQCDEAVARPCRAAVDELAAARKLIEAQTAELAAAKAALDAKATQLKLLADANQALIEQVEALKEAGAARAEQVKGLEELAGKFQLRVGDLEKDLKKQKSRGRKSAGLAFGAGLLLGIGAGR